MIKINLVPSELLDKARQRQQTIQVIAIAGFAAIVVAGVSAIHLFKAQRLESELAAKKEEMKLWQAKLDKLSELESRRAAVKERIKVINDLRTGRPLYPLFMSEFVGSVPAGVNIKNLSVTNLPNLSLKLSMGAESRTSEDILNWIKAMGDTGKFSALEIGPVSVTVAADGAKAYVFTMTGNYVSKL